MAQGNRSTRPRTACCRCRRRVEGNSRLTNLGLLCDSCYELLQRSELGRRLYRLVYQFTGRRPRVTPEPARTPEIVAREREEKPVAALVG